MRENPVDLGTFMGVIYLHFSALIINIDTLLDAVLLTVTEELFLVVPPSKYVDVSQLAGLEVSSHMTKSFLAHWWQLLKLVTHQTVSSIFLSRLRLFVGDGGYPEEKGFIRKVIEVSVDASTKEDGLVADEGDEHEVVGRVRVAVEHVGLKKLLRLLEYYLLGLVLGVHL